MPLGQSGPCLQRVALLGKAAHAVEPVVHRVRQRSRSSAGAEAGAAGGAVRVGAPQAAQRHQAPRVQHHLYHSRAMLGCSSGCKSGSKWCSPLWSLTGRPAQAAQAAQRQEALEMQPPAALEGIE